MDFKNVNFCELELFHHHIIMEIHGYKGFNPDMTCRGYRYKVGETFHHEGVVEAEKSGFHFCDELKNVFRFYPHDSYVKPGFVYCKVVGSGTISRSMEVFAASTLRVVEKLNGDFKLFKFLYTFKDGIVVEINYDWEWISKGSNIKQFYS